jgi:jumonji domain-containing protein 7
MFPEMINFVQEVFGVSPDAVNLWIGNEQVVSSMQKDHYENVFYVLSEEKVFVLCPPADAPFLYQAEFDRGHSAKMSLVQKSRRTSIERSFFAECPSGTFQQQYSGESIVTEKDGDSQVKWIQGNVEPLVDNKDAVPTNQPLISWTHPIRVHVKAEEMLYLPALWFHQVAQTCKTVGINYWYDMQFDSPNLCYLLQPSSATSCCRSQNFLYSLCMGGGGVCHNGNQY